MLGPLGMLAALLLPSQALATEDALALVPQPLDTQQGEIAVVEVPFIIGKALPESAFSAIGAPYVPPAVSFHQQTDINLASVAGIQVKPFHQSGRDYRIELDYSRVDAKYHTEELLGAVLDCVYRVAGDNISTVIAITGLEPDADLHRVLLRLTAKKDKAKR